MRALRAAKENAVDALIEANQEFHLQLARMTHNRELELRLRGMLERSTRLVYLAARGARQAPRDSETPLKPIADAIKKKNVAVAHAAVVADITQGQLNALGRELWDSSMTPKRGGSELEKNR